MTRPADFQCGNDAAQGTRIRPARMDDLDALIALENATFSSDRLSPRQWRRHLASDSVSILVAANPRAVLAAALLLFRRNSRIARLYSLAVGADARGLGLGDALLAACEDESRQRACALLRLEVRRDNLVAQRLYQRRGYHLFATHTRYYEDGDDALRFEKSLSEN